MMTHSRQQTPLVAVDYTPGKGRAGVELPYELPRGSTTKQHRVIARTEFVEVWLSKALLANANGFVPVLARQLFAAHLAQLGRAWGAAKLSLGPARSASGEAVVQALAPDLTISGESGLATGRTVLVTSDLLDIDEPQEFSNGQTAALLGSSRLAFRDGIPVRCGAERCTLGAILSRIGLDEGFAALVETHRHLEARCLGEGELARKRALDAEWARLVATAGWFHPRRRELDRSIAALEQKVHGEITLAVSQSPVARLRPTPLGETAPIRVPSVAAVL